VLINYFTVALRNLLKYKLYSLVNVFGMAFGVAFFTLILLLIRYEWSYDTFHKHYRSIYRAIKITEKDGIEERSACMPFPFAPTVQADFPQDVAETVRIFNFQVPSHSVSANNTLYSEPLFYFVDSSFFKVFDYPLAKGDPKKVLSKPLSVVISDRKAKEYFGNQDPIGKTIEYEGLVGLVVTGVFAPKTYPSHFNFDFIAPISSLEALQVEPEMVNDNWKWDPCWTYVLLKNDTSPEDLEAKFEEIVQAHFPPAFRDESRVFLQPLSEIHLYSDLEYELEPNGDAHYVFIFASIGVLILIIATINFTNLSSAKSALRTREIGIRKAIGAFRHELAEQFLVEHVLIGLVAVGFAFILIELMLPLISEVANADLTINVLSSWSVVLIIVGAGVVVGALSSIYPAYYLTHYQPSEVLSGSMLLGVRGKQLRGILIIIQFVITVFLLITMIVSFRQQMYLRYADLGFNKEDVIILPVSTTDLRFVFDSLRQGFLESPDIEGVTAMEDVLGTGHRTHDYLPETSDPFRKQWMFFPSLMVRSDFLEVFQIELLAGRGFHPDSLRDDDEAVIINEEMVHYLGWKNPEEAIGKHFRSRGGNERIIGVTGNFNFESLHNNITPFVFDIPSEKFKFFFTKFIAIRVAAGQQHQALQHVREKWFELVPNRTFEHYFLEMQLSKQYYKELKLSQITAYFALAAILIASLGMFGLSSFIVGIRRKEIAIRKAIGTTNFSIVILLMKEFLVLIGIALAIGFPVGYFIMANWLSSFPFHISMSLDIFGYAGFIVLVSTILTVGFHTIRAAVEEPAEALQI
jgi:putative ABC transport system permease protein